LAFRLLAGALAVGVVGALASACRGGEQAEEDGGVQAGEGRIVFDSFRGDNWNIYVIGADGAGEGRLTSDAAWDSQPAW
jgi:hypothetical protein